MCDSVWTVHMNVVSVEARGGMRSPRVGVTGGCELPVVSTREQTWVF